MFDLDSVFFASGCFGFGFSNWVFDNKQKDKKFRKPIIWKSSMNMYVCVHYSLIESPKRDI